MKNIKDESLLVLNKLKQKKYDPDFDLREMGFLPKLKVFKNKIPKQK